MFGKLQNYKIIKIDKVDFAQSGNGSDCNIVSLV